MYVPTGSISSVVRLAGFGHWVSKSKQLLLSYSVKRQYLTVCTNRPVRLTELIVWKTSEAVVVLVVVTDESVVSITSIALVDDSLIMSRRIVWIPEQQQLTLCWRIWGIDTVGPYIKKCENEFEKWYIHSQLSGNAERDQVLFA